MAIDEQPLLENMLDALDRLYDHQSSPLDVQALAQATAAAVSSPEMARELSAAASALLVLIRSRLPESDEYHAALDATHDLRLRLAAAL
jgi:hypothetical protein